MRNAKPLPAGLMRELFDYDPETGRLFWRSRADRCPRWNGKHAGKEAGSRHPKSTLVRINHSGTRRNYPVHHIAWAIKTGSWPEEIIDHADRNPHNNAWRNLRPATLSGNSSNNTRRQGSTGFKGVSYRKAAGKFVAQIQSQGTKMGLGYFDSAEEAALVYDAAALRFHGEFAVTNEMLGLVSGGDAHA